MTLCEQVGELLPNLDAVNSVEECDKLREELIELIEGLKVLRLYANLKGTTVHMRLAGRVVLAQSYESNCEEVFDRLPTWAKW
jgi:hypothetical protein